VPVRCEESGGEIELIEAETASDCDNAHAGRQMRSTEHLRLA
jgi:hypothetical protein